MKPGTISTKIPYTLAGNRDEAMRQLSAIAKRGDWVGVLGVRPLDDRVLWTMDEECVTLYWRQEVPEEDPGPLVGGGRA